MRLRERYRRLTVWNKVGFWGSVVSILGFVGWLLGQFYPNTPDPILTELGRRPPQQIDRITLTVSFALPLDHPELSDYAARVDAGLREFIAGGPKAWDAQTNSGRIQTIGERQVTIGPRGSRGEVWLIAGHPLFPSHDSQRGLPRNSLSLSVIELAFYRTPISVDEFRVSWASVMPKNAPRPSRPKPDLGIEAVTPMGARWVMWARVFAETTAKLTLGPANLSKSGWRQDSGLIQYIEDLPGSQLMIDVGTHNLGGPKQEVTAALELVEFTLRVNNRTVAITIDDDLKKHLTDDGDPFWEFNFPVDEAAIFATK